jgi:IclR family acetate operon transcriptional repressor
VAVLTAGGLVQTRRLVHLETIIPRSKTRMPREKAPAEPAKPRVQTAARTIAILQSVSRAGGDGITAKQISEELGLPRQVVYHLVHTLVQVKMLRRARGTNLVLGIGVAGLAHGFHMQMSASGFLARCAKAAADATGETAYVSGWLDGDIVVLATARGSAPIQAAEVPQGTTGFAHARASGKLLLAMCPPEEIDAYLSSHRLEARTPNTITRPAALRAEFQSIRACGVGYDREEFAAGLSCMAVPLGPAPSRFVLGVSAPTQRFCDHHDGYLKVLTDVARSVGSESII